MHARVVDAEEEVRFTFAVSGGQTPWAMFADLRGEAVPWQTVEVFQVDERVAPEGHPDRNLTHLRQSLGPVEPMVRPMPVEEPDLEAAASHYAAILPDRFDLVHLGIGPDGHTASLVPDDPVLDLSSPTSGPLVGVTGPYQGRRRMTFTYAALARAGQLLWLVTGEEKREALAKLLEGDRSIPAGRVEAARSLVIADRAAAGA